MSTPLPELPKAEVHRAVWDGDWHQYHDRSDPLPTTWDDEPPDEVCGFVSVDLVRAYGLAVWKAAIEQAVEVAESDEFYGNATQHLIAEALRSLPLPESDMTKETK